MERGKLKWQAKFDSIPDEQSIRSVKQIKLKGLSHPFFQVYGQTHMGNGAYYLYELVGQEMKLRARTRAVDRNQDGTYKIKGDWHEYDRLFKNDTLTARYHDMNGDGFVDIELTGVEELWYNDKKVKSWPARKVLIYNRRKGRFVEDRKKRIGFKQDMD